MKDSLEKTVRRQVSTLFASDDRLEQKYDRLLTFLNKKCPSELWDELRQIEPARDVAALAKWAKSSRSKARNAAVRIAFHLTHPASNAYGLEGCYYTTPSFERPQSLGKDKYGTIAGLVGLDECGRIIGIDNDDAPSVDVELADRYVPLMYAALVLDDWLAGDTAWFGSRGSDVYLINFGAEAIRLGNLHNVKFMRIREPLLG